MKRIVGTMVMVLLLGACGSDAPAPPPPEAPKPRQATIFDDQLKAKARAEQLKADEEERLRKMDEQLNDYDK